jgi:hypothetical protein
MSEIGAEQRFAVVMQMASELFQRGSWCGETHIQKAMYVYEAFSGHPLKYDFILYKHGPFSFDLRSELEVMRASGLISLTSRNQKYGPTIVTTDFGKKIQERAGGLVGRSQKIMDLVANWLGARDVKALERVATAVLVNEEMSGQTEISRAQRLHEYKPHIPMPEAEAAIREVDAKLAEVHQLEAGRAVPLRAGSW